MLCIGDSRLQGFANRASCLFGAKLQELKRLTYRQATDLVSDQVKCIFGGAGGKFLPDELRRGGNGNMPACELADVLAKITELWWAGQEADARAMHRRLLPLTIRACPPFWRYILKRRGIFSNVIDRANPGKQALNEGDKREIDILLETIAGDIDAFPILPE